MDEAPWYVKMPFRYLVPRLKVTIDNTLPPRDCKDESENFDLCNKKSRKAPEADQRLPSGLRTETALPKVRVSRHNRFSSLEQRALT